ncbi:MAG: SMC-Scp complex subunit ScpB [Proteobacteria bacterium]|nr:SMC-Scp complex subunit ScpB [Pseudomonadota bacterium]
MTAAKNRQGVDDEDDDSDAEDDDDSDDDEDESDDDDDSDEEDDDLDDEDDDDSDDEDESDDDDDFEEDGESDEDESDDASDEDDEEDDDHEEDVEKAVVEEASEVEAPAVETSEAEGSEAEPREVAAPEAEAVIAAAAGAAGAAAAAGQVTDVVPSDHAQHLRLLEALVFAGAQALDEKDLAERLPNDADVARLLADLAELYANRGVNLIKVAGGYAFRTAPDLAEKLKIERPVTRKLSRASVETLAIIAYHQPVTRAEIEQVRGVGLSKGTLDLLFEQNWIKPMGRRRAPGKPVTWGTTDFFLEHFGLPSLDDLPGQEELKAAGLLDQRAQPPIFRPEEPDLPLEPTEEEAAEPLATEETGR